MQTILKDSEALFTSPSNAGPCGSCRTLPLDLRGSRSTDIWQTSSIQTGPSTLLLQLNRRRGNGFRNNKRIEVAPVIKIHIEGAPVHYELRAVGYHLTQSTMVGNGGHWITDVLSGGNFWRYNDAAPPVQVDPYALTEVCIYSLFHAHATAHP